MKFKLDENFGHRTLQLFRAEGHDVTTVAEEGLSGCPDQELYGVCVRESRCLVTLDLDFSDVTRFTPGRSGGIAVFRLPRNPTLPVIEGMVTNLLSMLSSEQLTGKLWVVEPGRVRVHQAGYEFEEL